MSCWCAYLVREVDQSIFCTLRKGRVEIITSAADRDSLLARVREDRIPNKAPTPDGYVDGYACQGFLFDFSARCHRFYPCSSERARLDQLHQALRGAPIWQGWDAGIAFGGREELGELMPAAARWIKPYEILDKALNVPRLRPRDDWFVNWDPNDFVLSVRESALWDASHDGLEGITIITPSGTALDFRLVTPDTSPLHPILAWLRGGPDAVSSIVGSAAPYPPPGEDEIVEHLVVVDHPRSTIHYSPSAFAPARLLQAVRSAWPGWQLQMLPSGQQVTTLPDGTPLRRPRLDILPLSP